MIDRHSRMSAEVGLRAVVVWSMVGIPSALGQRVLYVDQNASTMVQDALSWCTAAKNLQTVLVGAMPGDEIRVADGVYRPASGTNRFLRFQLRQGVKVRGGFSGCGTADPDARDWVLYATVLSGDLLGDDDPLGPAGPGGTCCGVHAGPGCDNATCQASVCAAHPNCCSGSWSSSCAAAAAELCCALCSYNVTHCDNSYHVVDGSGVGSGTELDGFTITGGYANGTNPQDRGGGIFNYFTPGSPTYRHCIIRDNYASQRGGGVYNDLMIGRYEDCLMVGNRSGNFGGGMYNSGSEFNGLVSSPLILNVTIVSNVAVKTGGIYNDPILDGLAMHPTIFSSILWGNTDAGGMDESAQITSGGGTAEVRYSIVQGLTGQSITNPTNFDDDPLFVHPTGADGILGTSDDDWRLQTGSPAINQAAPETGYPSSATDLDGNGRIIGCRADIGAYESALPQNFGDFDDDGDVDLQDLAVYQTCPGFTASTGGMGFVCVCLFDADGSGTIDSGDTAEFVTLLLGG